MDKVYLEDVIHGLECCSGDVPEIPYCEGCAYNDETGNHDCVGRLMQDAIRFLKEQDKEISRLGWADNKEPR